MANAERRNFQSLDRGTYLQITTFSSSNHQIKIKLSCSKLTSFGHHWLIDKNVTQLQFLVVDNVKKIIPRNCIIPTFNSASKPFLFNCIFPKYQSSNCAKLLSNVYDADRDSLKRCFNITSCSIQSTRTLVSILIPSRT